MGVKECLSVLKSVLIFSTPIGKHTPALMSLNDCILADDLPTELKKDVLGAYKLLDRWCFDYYTLYHRAATSKVNSKILELYQKLCVSDNAQVVRYLESIIDEWSENTPSKERDNLKTTSYGIFREIYNKMLQPIDISTIKQLTRQFEEQIILPYNFPSTELECETAELREITMYIYSKLVYLGNAVKRLGHLKIACSMASLDYRGFYYKEVKHLEEVINKIKKAVGGESRRVCFILGVR